MPEIPFKNREHPSKFAWDQTEPHHRPAVQYAELCVTSNFTFLTGASHPNELGRAGRLSRMRRRGDHRCKRAGRHRPRTRRRPRKRHPVCRRLAASIFAAHPAGCAGLSHDLKSYGRLCRLLTLGKHRAEKGGCDLAIHDFLEESDGLLAAVIPPPAGDSDFICVLEGLAAAMDDDWLSLAACCVYGHDDRGDLDRLAILSRETGVPLVATNDVHYHVPQRRPLQDVLTCIREGCTIAAGGLAAAAKRRAAHKNARRNVAAFAQHPQAIARTMQIRGGPRISASINSATSTRTRSARQARCPSNTFAILSTRAAASDIQRAYLTKWSADRTRVGADRGTQLRRLLPDRL